MARIFREMCISFTATTSVSNGFVGVPRNLKVVVEAVVVAVVLFFVQKPHLPFGIPCTCAMHRVLSTI